MILGSLSSGKLETGCPQPGLTMIIWLSSSLKDAVTFLIKHAVFVFWVASRQVCASLPVPPLSIALTCILQAFH